MEGRPLKASLWVGVGDVDFFAASHWSMGRLGFFLLVHNYDTIITVTNPKLGGSGLMPESACCCWLRATFGLPTLTAALCWPLGVGGSGATTNRNHSQQPRTANKFPLYVFPTIIRLSNKNTFKMPKTLISKNCDVTSQFTFSFFSLTVLSFDRTGPTQPSGMLVGWAGWGGRFPNHPAPSSRGQHQDVQQSRIMAYRRRVDCSLLVAWIGTLNDCD